ncbi:uncharacterized protein LOC113462772 [Phoenix dactylifera]|uniref:Uncharacterized protein LOC113462772 n=2 Tax=Phoenix dactylifera TaxID=42345 RepID=A0A8B9B080_PHODC|nr:uncharacterized protein LOC113462772 [Phoenix dactylifera]
MEASMAEYIIQQYIATSGGEQALNSVSSMYTMGKVRMTATEFRAGNGNNASHANKKASKGGGGGEMGGFVLWQKKPDLWCLELVVAGCKISAGSDGKVAWRQTAWLRLCASANPSGKLATGFSRDSADCRHNWV